ncbi:MAG TPA: hypothetical protein PKC29_14790 [Thermodesulfobacteriota bacterium]|nr:hypothetical protein [Thermodesulfobacteriota bacterium]
MEIERMRDLYQDLTDDEIEKAQEQINYVLCDSATGEIVQTGSMDRLAFERFEPYREGMEKAIVPPGEEWMLRGEFVDYDNTHRPMFKIEEGSIVAKEAHVDKISEMRMPKDGVKKKPIEVEGVGGKEIIGFETVQEPLRVEGAKAGTKPE